MFYAHVQEMGEGCDYTIGCGHRLVKLKATTREEAEREVMQDDSEGAVREHFPFCEAVKRKAPR